MRWVVFREEVIGRVDATNRLEAEVRAARRYGPAVRVQSEPSYRVALEEAAAITRSRRIEGEDQ